MRAMIVGLALVVTGQMAWGQDASTRQLQAMERLAPLAGSWRVTGQILTPSGAVDLRAGTAETVFAFNDRGLDELAVIDLGSPDLTQMRSTFSYDPYRSLYRVTVMDDAYGLMDVYEGDFDAEGRLVVTNLRSDTSFPIQGGQLHFKLVYDFSPDNAHDFDVYLSTDRGESWSLYFDQHYEAVSE